MDGRIVFTLTEFLFFVLKIEVIYIHININIFKTVYLKPQVS